MGRRIVTNVLTDSMFSAVRSGCIVKVSETDLFNLRGLSLISAIKEKLISDKLKREGFNLEVNPIKITLLPGDILYVVNPGIKLRNNEENEKIMDYLSITITKYEVVK